MDWGGMTAVSYSASCRVCCDSRERPICSKRREYCNIQLTLSQESLCCCVSKACRQNSREVSRFWFILSSRATRLSTLSRWLSSLLRKWSRACLSQKRPCISWSGWVRSRQETRFQRGLAEQVLLSRLGKSSPSRWGCTVSFGSSSRVRRGNRLASEEAGNCSNRNRLFLNRGIVLEKLESTWVQQAADWAGVRWLGGGCRWKFCLDSQKATARLFVPMAERIGFGWLLIMVCRWCTAAPYWWSHRQDTPRSIRNCFWQTGGTCLVSEGELRALPSRMAWGRSVCRRWRNRLRYSLQTRGEGVSWGECCIPRMISCRHSVVC